QISTSSEGSRAVALVSSITARLLLSVSFHHMCSTAGGGATATCAVRMQLASFSGRIGLAATQPAPRPLGLGLGRREALGRLRIGARPAGVHHALVPLDLAGAAAPGDATVLPGRPTPPGA